ncbi:MAG TPA: DUF1338 family protein [Phycisphaerae bacterium]|nr:DUF1338 family protein [Phycisphaerales bacterium]HRX86303.1 DUF1338 family protein [Phycisphaerae bacterium]
MVARRVLDLLFDRLWQNYRRRVPYAERYVQLVTERGGRVVNDHIAFRTLNVDLPMQPAGLEALRRIFTTLGYHEATQYDFPETHLTAVHLLHDDPWMPKLFISQLEVSQLPEDIAGLITRAAAVEEPTFDYPYETLSALAEERLDTRHVTEAVDRLVAVFQRPWAPPPRSTVLAANAASQYAAWTLLHGSAVNHFTAWINEHAVDAWPDIEATVEGLRAAGVPMKAAIEGAPGSKLRQSATAAADGDFPVTEDDGSVGALHWTYAYYELAERGQVQDESGAWIPFTGFLGAQTPGLFEMTRLAPSR